MTSFMMSPAVTVAIIGAETNNFQNQDTLGTNALGFCMMFVVIAVLCGIVYLLDR